MSLPAHPGHRGDGIPAELARAPGDGHVLRSSRSLETRAPRAEADGRGKRTIATTMTTSPFDLRGPARLARLVRLTHVAAALVLALLLSACPGSSSTEARTDNGVLAVPVDTSGPVGLGGFTILNPTSARPYFHDFGRVLYGERMRHVFQLRNDEGRPLVVKDMIPSCSCTVGRISYTGPDGTVVLGTRERGRDVLTVPAGAVVDLEVVIDTTMVENLNIDKLSQLRLRCDSVRNPYLTFEMHLLVARPFRSVPDRMQLGEVPQSFGKSGRVDISTALKGDASKIREIASVEGTFTAEIQATEIVGEPVWILTVNAPPGLPLGPARGQVTMRTTAPDGSEGGAFSVTILAQVVPDIVVHPGILDLASLLPGQGGTRPAEIVSLVPGARVRVTGTRVEGDDAADFTIETKPIDPDESGKSQRHSLVLKCRPERKPGAFRGVVVIEFDSKETPRITVPFAGSVL